MITIKREEFKGPSADPLWIKLFDYIKSIHICSNEALTTLKDNLHTPHFTVMTRDFFFMKAPEYGKPDIYFSYDVWSQIDERGHLVYKFEAIHVYDDKFESELARTNVNKN